MKSIRAVGRLFFFVGYTVFFVAGLVVRSFFARNLTDFGIERRKKYATLMLPVLGIRCTVEGELPGGACLMMGNHRSYLDPVIVARDVPAVPVSKAEFASWPIIGYGAKLTGVIFLKRESTLSRKKTLDAIAEKTGEGYTVVLFPEGTTHSKHATIPLRRGGFQLAAKHNIPVTPFALNFQYAADNWIDDDTFIGHFMRRFGNRTTRLRIAYGPAIQNADPDVLLQETQTWIDAKLKQWKEEGWNQ